MKCHAPPSEPGFVRLQLFFEGQVAAQGRALMFEYKEREGVNLKKKRARNDQVEEGSGSQWLLGKNEQSSREFKVRIVERLTYLEQKLNNPDSTQALSGVPTDDISQSMSQLSIEEGEAPPNSSLI